MKRFYVLIALALFLSPERAETFTGALPVGPGIKFTCQTSAPAPINSSRDWVRCSDGHRIQTNASNVDTDVTAAVATTGVTPGSYSNANITVGSDGRLTAASNGSAGGGGGYSTVQQNATPLTQRSVINFSPRLLCADNSGATRTDCDLSASGVAASTYGDSTHVPQITFDTYGRATAASTVAITTLPTQTGNNGKFLTTDGTNASWATVNSLPTQTGNSGKFLTTDGTNASWSTPLYRVRRTIAQPADATDFFVTIGVTLSNDSYAVSCTQSGGSIIVGIMAPDVAGSDRTTTQFRVLTSDALSTGDTIDCIVSQF